ncbi:MAG TPA: hypothetical protein PLN69_04520 [bacterium]|nr:hypothetical protein [bacterium]
MLIFGDAGPAASEATAGEAEMLQQKDKSKDLIKLLFLVMAQLLSDLKPMINRL